MCIKSDFEEIILKLATCGQREKVFLLSSKFCSQWIVCSGAIYMYKSIKIYTRTRCQVNIYRSTGPLVIFLFIFYYTSSVLKYFVSYLASYDWQDNITEYKACSQLLTEINYNALQSPIYSLKARKQFIFALRVQPCLGKWHYELPKMTDSSIINCNE